MAEHLPSLETAYRDMSTLLTDLTDADATRPTGCAGWAVLDLAQHLVFDARRGLVALATPAQDAADTDAVEYWRAWQQSRLDPGTRVRTQGRVLTVADLASTLVVETAMHHLDLVRELDREGPAAAPLAEVRPDADRLPLFA